MARNLLTEQSFLDFMLNFFLAWLVVLSDNNSKQFGPRSGPTECWSWSGSKLFDTLIVFLKDFFEKVNFEKKSASTKAWNITQYAELKCVQPCQKTTQVSMAAYYLNGCIQNKKHLLKDIPFQVTFYIISKFKLSHTSDLCFWWSYQNSCIVLMRSPISHVHEQNAFVQTIDMLCRHLLKGTVILSTNKNSFFSALSDTSQKFNYAYWLSNIHNHKIMGESSKFPKSWTLETQKFKTAR